MKPSLLLSILAFFALAWTSCDRNRVFEENITVPGATWNKDSVARFVVSLNDTLSSHNIYINVRHNGRYAAGNLYLFITIKGPDGNMLRDTFNCILADDKGEWLGSGLGDLFSNQILFKQNVFFPKSGDYLFEIEQATRTDNLKNVEDIGLRIEAEQLIRNLLQ